MIKGSRDCAYISSGNMEQERLQLMMKCERLSSHRRRLEAALQFCHSHSLVMASDDHAPVGATPTQHQLHRKLSKATQVVIELVNQKEQLLSIVNKLRDKIKSSEQKTESSSSHDAKSCDVGSHDHKNVVPSTTTPANNHIRGTHNRNTHHSTPLQNSFYDSSHTKTPVNSHHGNGHDKQMTSEESFQVTDSFELSCQQHHKALENILNTAAADNLLSSEDDHAPSNRMIVRGKRLGHPPVSTQRSRDHVSRRPTKSSKKPHY